MSGKPKCDVLDKMQESNIFEEPKSGMTGIIYLIILLKITFDAILVQFR